MTFAVNHFINNVDVQNGFNADFIRQYPEYGTVFFKYILRVGNDHQNPESPFPVFLDWVNELFGIIIRIDDYIMNIMSDCPVMLKNFIGKQPEYVKRKQVNYRKGNLLNRSPPPPVDWV